MSERVAIVTGAGRGIGRAICLRFAREGFRVVAAARTSAQLAETKSKVESQGGKCVTHSTDVSSPDEVADLIDFAAKQGRIEVLVNCAAVAPVGLVEEFDIPIFESVTSVNMAAVFYTSKAVWPAMRKAGGGVIVNISSVAAKDPFPGFAVYGASKAWVNAFTAALAKEGQKHHIYTYCIAPGAVETQMLRGAFPDFPTEKTMRPEDVANVVYEITQPHYKYATGQTIYVQK